MVVFAGTKGQGATEYLVILAVVLIVAMVVIALLGFFPGTAYDTKKSESDTYWNSMKPLQVVSSSQAANGNLSVVLLNVASDQLQITNLSVSGGGCDGATVTPLYISGGDQKTLTTNFTSCSCASGSVYEYSMNITYVRSGLAQTEFGAKTLIGKCT